MPESPNSPIFDWIKFVILRRGWVYVLISRWVFLVAFILNNSLRIIRDYILIVFDFFFQQRRGPQRSVDVIVSGAFILTLLLLAFLSVEWLKDSVQLQSQHTLEALIWSCALGCFLLRFMTLGTKINRKYRSISVLITEQINLYLQVKSLFYLCII